MSFKIISLSNLSCIMETEDTRKTSTADTEALMRNIIRAKKGYDGNGSSLKVGDAKWRQS